MDYEASKVAICISDHKRCALFFDHIYPIFLSRTESMKVARVLGEELIIEVIKDSKSRRFLDRIAQIGFSGSVAKLEDAEPFAKAIRDIFRDEGIRAAPVGQSFFGVDDPETIQLSDAIEISYEGARLVDVSKLSWAQISEIRRDGDARKKLRNYRLFIAEDFIGKPLSYVKDSLEKKMEEYEEACKKHGLDLLLGTIGVLIDSKSLLGALTIIAVGILVGEPMLTDVGLLSGSAIEIGKMSLHFAETKRQFQSYRENHELAYMMYLKQEQRTA